MSASFCSVILEKKREAMTMHADRLQKRMNAEAGWMITEFMHNHKAEQAAAGQRLGEQQDNKARSTHLAFSFFCVCACVCVRESSFAFFLWKMHFVLLWTGRVVLAYGTMVSCAFILCYQILTC